MVSTCRNEGDPFFDSRDTLVKAMDRAAHEALIKTAVAAERERCAKIVESASVAALSKNRVGASLDCLETIAALIRNKE
jgi:hypothetical protein